MLSGCVEEKQVKKQLKIKWQCFGDKPGYDRWSASSSLAGNDCWTDEREVTWNGTGNCADMVVCLLQLTLSKDNELWKVVTQFFASKIYVKDNICFFTHALTHWSIWRKFTSKIQDIIKASASNTLQIAADTVMRNFSMGQYSIFKMPLSKR